jgi:hypothetical protein
MKRLIYSLKCVGWSISHQGTLVLGILMMRRSRVKRVMSMMVVTLSVDSAIQTLLQLVKVLKRGKIALYY